MNLKDWRKSKGLTQGAVAEKLGTMQTTYQAWESGKNEIPHLAQAKLRKLGFDGPWPAEEAQAAPVPAGGPYVTVAEFLEWKGYQKAKMEMLERALENLAEVVRAHFLKGPQQGHPEGR